MSKVERDVSEFEREWINFLVPILNNQDNEIMNARVRRILDKVEQWHKSERKKWALELLGKNKEFNYNKNAHCLAMDRGYDEAKAEIRKKIKEG